METREQDVPAPDFYKTTGDWNKAYDGKEYSNQTGLYVSLVVIYFGSTPLSFCILVYHTNSETPLLSREHLVQERTRSNS